MTLLILPGAGYNAFRLVMGFNFARSLRSFPQALLFFD